jgi:hypothetical protein
MNNNLLFSMFKATDKSAGKAIAQDNVVLSRTLPCHETAPPISQNQVFGNHPSVVYAIPNYPRNSIEKRPQSVDDKLEGGTQSKTQEMHEMFKMYGSNDSESKQHRGSNAASLLGGERGLKRMKEGLNEELRIPLVL